MLLLYSGFARDDSSGILIQNLVHFHRFILIALLATPSVFMIIAI